LGGVGDRARVGPFVEIQRGVQLGADCKIQNHTSVCEGVTIRDRVFVGHGVVFIPTGICRKRSSKKSRASVRPLRFSAEFASARARSSARESSCHIRCRSRRSRPWCPRACVCREQPLRRS